MSSMNREQMLFLVASEEASEVAKELVKCIRFTPMHKHVDYEATNYVRMRKEWNELQAMMEMLEEHMEEHHGFQMTGEVLREERMRRHVKRQRFEQFSKISEKLHDQGTSDCALNLCNSGGPHENGCYLTQQVETK